MLERDIAALRVEVLATLQQAGTSAPGNDSTAGTLAKDRQGQPDAEQQPEQPLLQQPQPQGVGDAIAVDSERVLVVVLAQTRGWPLTWVGFQQHVLGNLVPDDPGAVDLALCVGKEANTSNPFYAHANHVWEYPEVDDWGKAYDEIRKQTGSQNEWRVVLAQGNQLFGGIVDADHPQGGSAGILIFMRWFLVQQLQKHSLVNAYDRFIVTRSDYVWRIPHPPLSVLCPHNIWIPDGERYGGYTDRHIVVPQKWVVDALDFLSDMIRDPDAYLKHMQAWTQSMNFESFIVWNMKRKGLDSSVRFFPYVAYTTRDPNDDRGRWSKGLYNESAGVIIKYQAEYDNYLKYKEIIRNNADWAAYMAKPEYACSEAPPDQPWPMPRQ